MDSLDAISATIYAKAAEEHAPHVDVAATNKAWEDRIEAARPGALATIDLKAVALSRFGEWREGAVALVQKYKGVVFDCLTTKGMAEAVAARMEVRAPRYAAQNVAKASKSELAAVSKAVGAEEEAIIKFLAETEAAIDSQIRAAEERKAMEKAERERQEAEAAAAEIARIKRHREAIEVIHQYPIHAVGLPAERIEKGVKALQEMVFGDAQEECLPDYQRARDAALAKMLEMLDDVWKREAEDIKLKAQFAEIARREKELAEREARMAAFEAERKAEAARVKAANEESARQEAARLEAEFAAAAAAAAEAARIEALATQLREELAGSNQPAAAPGGPTAADQAQAEAQVPGEAAAPLAGLQPDIPGIPVPPTDEEAAAAAPNLITLGEVQRRIGFKVTMQELGVLGFQPDAKRGNGQYYREKLLIQICHALAVHFTKAANRFEEELA